MINEQKTVLIKEIKQLKNTLSFQQKVQCSNVIFSKVEQMQAFKDAKIILAYWALPDEVQTSTFILKHEKHKRFILPKVEGNILVLKEFKGMASLNNDNAFGIYEPTGENYLEFDKIDLIIVPGIAFDKQNNRMGRGKAFYDGILNKLAGVKIGVCFDFQLFENIPAAEHDIKMDYVITN